MPCHDYRPSEGEERVQREVDAQQVKIDELTRMLCSVVRRVHEVPYMNVTDLPNDVVLWYEIHVNSPGHCP